MAIEGIDYSYGSGLTAAAIKQAGKDFVCRYLAPLPNGKVITRGEFAALTGAGLDVVLVWEGDGHDSGSGQGAAAAREAGRQADALGATGIPIYFAPSDYDSQPAEQPGLNDYMDGAASVIGRDRVGGYGGIGPVSRWLDAGKISYGWQTYAWSGGQWDGRAQLQQYRNGVRFGPAEVDLDRAMTADYGQWPRPTTAPAEPGTEEDDMATSHLPQTVGQTVTIAWAPGAVKGFAILTDPEGPTTWACWEHHRDPSKRWVKKADLKVETELVHDLDNPKDCTGITLKLYDAAGRTEVGATGFRTYT